MIISLYSTKGGVGKTTTAIALLGAIAEANAKLPEQERHSVLAVDADRQGTLTQFGKNREEKGAPAYGIDFIQIDPDEVEPEELRLKASHYDIAIVDLPGFYDERGTRMVLSSDVVLIPTDLGIAEVDVAFDLMNKISRLVEEYDLETKHALLITKVEPSMNFINKFQKMIFGTTIEAGYAILDAKMSLLAAHKNTKNFASYAFEQAAEDPASKGISWASDEGRGLLQAAINYKLVEGEIDKADFLLYNLGKEMSK